MKIFMVSLGVCLLATVSSAEEVSAQWEPARASGFELSARLGASSTYEPGMAVFGFSRQELSAPVWVDVGYRVTPRWFLGGYVQVAPTLIRVREEPNYANIASGLLHQDVIDVVLRFGAETTLHFRAEERLQPWLGLGSGVSWNPGPHTYRALLWEMANIQGGADYRLSANWSLGLFASLAATLVNFEFAGAYIPDPNPDPVVWKNAPVSVLDWRGTVGIRGTFGGGR